MEHHGAVWNRTRSSALNSSKCGQHGKFPIVNHPNLTSFVGDINPIITLTFGVLPKFPRFPTLPQRTRPGACSGGRGVPGSRHHWVGKSGEIRREIRVRFSDESWTRTQTSWVLKPRQNCWHYPYPDVEGPEFLLFQVIVELNSCGFGAVDP